MQIMTEEEIKLVSGGMKWEGNRQSDNVLDFRSGIYVNRDGMCWNPQFFGLRANFP
jgi:hypothetical protein